MLPQGVSTTGSFYLIGERKFARVTSTCAIPDKHLDTWAAGMAAKAAVSEQGWRSLPEPEAIKYLKTAHERDRDSKAARGTRVHEYLEALMYDTEPKGELEEQDVSYLEAADQLFFDHEITVLNPELLCVSETYEYAGTMDLLCVLDKKRVLLDWKTSAKIHDSYAWQLAAYLCADYVMDATAKTYPIEDLHIEGAGAVHLLADGYELFMLADKEKAFAEFLALHNFRMSRTRAGKDFLDYETWSAKQVLERKPKISSIHRAAKKVG